MPSVRHPCPCEYRVGYLNVALSRALSHNVLYLRQYAAAVRIGFEVRQGDFPALGEEQGVEEEDRQVPTTRTKQNNSEDGDDGIQSWVKYMCISQQSNHTNTVVVANALIAVDICDCICDNGCYKTQLGNRV